MCIDKLTFLKKFKTVQNLWNQLTKLPWKVHPFSTTCQLIALTITSEQQGSLKDSFIPAAKWQWSGLKIQISNWWPSIVTLTLSLHCWVMGSAHYLTEANIWPKFNIYLSKGSGDMEWTWNSRLKLVTFNCNLDLESACLSYRFRTLPH